MNTEETKFIVDDLLDLYLLAGALEDKLWQDEVLEKLQNYHKENSDSDSTSNLQHLWLEYKKVNMAILDLYNQVKKQSFTEDLQEKIWNLKYKRMELSRKISMEERKSQN